MTCQKLAVNWTVGWLVLCAWTISAHAQADAPAPARQPASWQVDAAAGNAAFQKEDWTAAVEAYRRALANGAASRLVHFRLGFSLHMLKQYEEALKHHLIAAQIPQKELRIDALYNASCASALLGRKDDALRYFERAIDAGFKDLPQVEKDTDLASLRDDGVFKALVASIGKAPRLAQQMNPFLGSWTHRNDKGEALHVLSLTRPLDGSNGILTTTTSAAGPSFTGLLVPNHADRTWMWVSADGLGTTRTLTGQVTEPAGVSFEGREETGAGPGAFIRVTLTPTDDIIKERFEVSDDGVAWRMHHEAVYSKDATKAENEK
jgi:hypothetical protein